jgi:indole-3-glycerol phosphate synthase
MSTILDQILADKRDEIAERKKLQPVERFPEWFPAYGTPPDFAASIRQGAPGVIAEVKRKSPSAGLIRQPFDPVGIAVAYEQHGARAISCLMDYAYFGGGEDDFETVRKAVRLPMLYKEFVVDPWQIEHARVMGASAVLLIAAALEPSQLRAFMEHVRALELCPLVEVHTADELEVAAACGAECIGINNRNLKTFETTLETTLELKARVSAEVLLISESGIRTPEDVARLRQAGVHGILVGESLLRQPDPGAALSQLIAE